MRYKILFWIFLISLNCLANEAIIDRMQKDIDYLDTKVEEGDSFSDHDLDTIPEQFHHADNGD